MTELTVSRGKINNLEAEMLKLPQVELTTNHYFCNGVYAREIHIPAGVTLSGKVHLSENMNILSAGEISVLTEDGIKRLTAPAIICSKAGIKRIGHAHTDATWVTILKTELTNPEEIVNQFTVSSFEEFEQLSAAQMSLLEEN